MALGSLDARKQSVPFVENELEKQAAPGSVILKRIIELRGTGP